MKNQLINVHDVQFEKRHIEDMDEVVIKFIEKCFSCTCDLVLICIEPVFLSLRKWAHLH